MHTLFFTVYRFSCTMGYFYVLANWSCEIHVSNGLFNYGKVVLKAKIIQWIMRKVSLFSKQMGPHAVAICLHGPGDKSCNSEVAMAVLNIPQSTSPSCFCTFAILTFMFSSNIEFRELLGSSIDTDIQQLQPVSTIKWDNDRIH